jgi:phosphoenolpyruvate carboxylase
MSELGETSCKAYRNVVYNNPHFISYFKHATPEAELGNLNIGERLSLDDMENPRENDSNYCKEELRAPYTHLHML